MDTLTKENPFIIQKWKVGRKCTRRSLTTKAKFVIGLSLIAISLVLIVAVIYLFVPPQLKEGNWLPNFVSESKLGKYRSAAISTDATPCTVIGKDILFKNGSAIDAAIAALLCMGVVNPQSMGLGGGFFMLYYKKNEGKVDFIDAREVAPIGASENMFGSNATLAKFGGLSVAVPGELLGYVTAHESHGILLWEELFHPTIKMCEEGITVTRHLARALRRYREEILAREHMRNIFMDPETKDVYKEGDVYKRLDLARTLKAISKEKYTALYNLDSNITHAFLEDLNKTGSIINITDMENYRVEIREPNIINIRGNMTLYSASLPGSGPLLAFILNVLDRFEDFVPNITKSRDKTVLALHRVIETFKFAYAHRMLLEDDNSAETLELMKKLRSRTYAEEIRKKIDDNHTHETDYYGTNVSIQENHGTAHLSIIAPNGDAVSATSTINHYFGSLVMSPSTGILLNNEMDDFSSPNITNFFGVPPTGKNKIRPKKRPMSSMAPAIIVDGNKNARLVVGGNGGTQITTSVAQVIIRNLWLKENIKQAIDAPRFHHQLLPNRIEHEVNFPKDILDDLKAKGHDLKRLGENMLGIILAITQDENGELQANSDYRKGGEVDGF